jgi:hypothetical protein
MVTPCQSCGQSFDASEIKIGGKVVFTQKTCPPCVAEREYRVSQEVGTEQFNRLTVAWQAICPAAYRDTDVKRIPAPFLKVLDSWEYGSRGVGLIGQAGERKTRTAFKILEKQHFAGVPCMAVTSTRFAKLATDQFCEDVQSRLMARDQINKLGTVKLVLFDDVGKHKMTDRVELEFFDLMETRTSNLLPIIWTANAKGRELVAMMSPDRGKPIVRRLAEFSEVISL